MSEVPSEVRHYWRRSRAPFLNLSDLDADALEATIAALGADRRDGTSRRVFGRLLVAQIRAVGARRAPR